MEIGENLETRTAGSLVRLTFSWKKWKKRSEHMGKKWKSLGKICGIFWFRRIMPYFSPLFPQTRGGGAWKRTQRCWGNKSGKKGDGPKISIFATSGHFQCSGTVPRAAHKSRQKTWNMESRLKKRLKNWADFKPFLNPGFHIPPSIPIYRVLLTRAKNGIYPIGKTADEMSATCMSQ